MAAGEALVGTGLSRGGVQHPPDGNNGAAHRVPQWHCLEGGVVFLADFDAGRVDVIKKYHFVVGVSHLLLSHVDQVGLDPVVVEGVAWCSGQNLEDAAALLLQLPRIEVVFELQRSFLELLHLQALLRACSACHPCQ